MNSNDRSISRLARSLAIVSIASLALVACGSGDTSTDPAPAASSEAPAEDEPAASGVDGLPDECRDILENQVDLVIDQFGDVDLGAPARDVQDVFSEPPPGFEDSDAEYESLGCNVTPTKVEDDLVESILRERAPDLADALFARSEFDTCDDALAIAEEARTEADAPLDLPFARYLESTRAFVSASGLCEPGQIPVELQAFYSDAE